MSDQIPQRPTTLNVSASVTSTIADPAPNSLAAVTTASSQVATPPAASSQVAAPAASESTEPATAHSPSDQTDDTSPSQLLSSFRSNMERRTTNWRSNLSTVLQEIRPLVQHAQSVGLNGPAATNPFHQWLPQANGELPPPTQSATPTQPQFYPPVNTPNPSMSRSPEASHIINMEQQPTMRSPVEHFHPTGGYSLIDMSRVQSTVHTPNPTPESPPTILDSRRAQILAGLQDPDPSQPTANSPTSPPTAPGTAPARTTSIPENLFAQAPELSFLLEAISRYIPYIMIVLCKILLDHMDGILDVLALVITFSHANWVLKQEVGRQAQRSVFKLVRELFYIVIVIAVIAVLLEQKNIFFSIVFAHQFSDLLTLRNLLFSVIVSDFVLKLMTVALKIIVTLLPGSMLEYKYRGRLYLAIEALSQMYRALSPILPWLVYLLDTYVGYEKFLGVLFSATYIVAKGTDLMTSVRFVKTALAELCKKVNFGTTPTKEQLQTAGPQCPICHDTYNTPVLLVCNHIFCESCVGTWFDREQTCPLCRAKVADDPAWRDGATTMFVQLY